MKPSKPHPDFPLFPSDNGQWAKKIKGKLYYFGSWRKDPKGEAAIKEYDARLPGILAGTDHLRYLAAGKGQMTVAELAAAFLVQKRQDAKSGTLSLLTLGNYIFEISRFVRWIKGETAVAALKPEHFAGYIKYLTEQGLRSRARKRVQAYLKAVFRWGTANGYCPLPNFGTAFKAPPTTKAAMRKEKARLGIADHSDRILTGEEIDQLLKGAQPNLKALILLGVNCGLGPADLGRMKWHHIDLENGVLNYPRGKTGTPRIGFLWKRTRKALERVRTLKYTKEAIEKLGNNASVFLTKKRQPYYREVERIIDNKLIAVYAVNAVTTTFARHAKALKLNGVSFYRLRHTMKTLGKKARDADALNLMMGHKCNTVATVYDHEEIEFSRIRRVAIVIKRQLWPISKGATQEDRSTDQADPEHAACGGELAAQQVPEPAQGLLS